MVKQPAPGFPGLRGTIASLDARPQLFINFRKALLFGTPCILNFSVTTQTVFASPRQIRFEVIGNAQINSVQPHSEIHEKKICEQKQQEAGLYRYTLRVEGWNNE